MKQTCKKRCFIRRRLCLQQHKWTAMGARLHSPFWLLIGRCLPTGLLVCLPYGTLLLRCSATWIVFSLLPWKEPKPQLDIVKERKQRRKKGKKESSDRCHSLRYVPALVRSRLPCSCARNEWRIACSLQINQTQDQKHGIVGIIKKGQCKRPHSNGSRLAPS